MKKFVESNIFVLALGIVFCWAFFSAPKALSDVTLDYRVGNDGLEYAHPSAGPFNANGFVLVGENDNQQIPDSYFRKYLRETFPSSLVYVSKATGEQLPNEPTNTGTCWTGLYSPIRC